VPREGRAGRESREEVRGVKVREDEGKETENAGTPEALRDRRPMPVGLRIK
jgi:hypothetical protein